MSTVFAWCGIYPQDPAIPAVVEYIAFVPLLCLIAVIILLATAPVDALLTRTVFAWLPSWYFYSNPAVFASYSRS